MKTTLEKYKELVTVLYRKTMRSEIEWDYSNDWACTNIAGRSIFLEEVTNKNFEEATQVDIRSGEGKKEVFTDDDLKGAPEVNGYESFYALMKDLRDTAIRQATGADKDIDAILSELNDDVPF